jgi:ABC-type multidrug transport system ATPase subunit
VIEIEGITVRYPGNPPVVALCDLSLYLRPGVTLIRGPSGAGKSTLLRVLAGLQVVESGTVRYPWPSVEVPQRTGYVPQENRLDQTLSVEDALRYLAGVRGLPCGRADVAPLMRRWGLELLRRRPVCQLSSGEVRRWLLAQSQLLGPDLWLLDEPLRGLDVHGVATVRQQLAAFRIGSARGEQRYAVVVAGDPRLEDLASAIIRLEWGSIPAT